MMCVWSWNQEGYEYISSVAVGDGVGDGGLELMAGEGLGCEDVGTFRADFGYDGVGCCVLSLTRQALAEVRYHFPARLRQVRSHSTREDWWIDETMHTRRKRLRRG